MDPFALNPNAQTYHIYYIRHGKTNCPPCIYGRTDVDIIDPDPQGFADFVSKHQLQDYHLCSSPLKRCRKTASYLHKAMAQDCQIEIIDDLQEIYLGELDGVPFDQYNKEQLKLLKVALKRPAYVKIRNAESVNTLKRRVLDVSTRLKNRRENIIAVTHCGVIKALFSQLSGINIKSNQLWLDWNLDFLAGLKVSYSYDPITGKTTHTFTILESVSNYDPK